jgi:hypothetical protein
MASKKDSRPSPRQVAQWRALPKPVRATGGLGIGDIYSDDKPWGQPRKGEVFDGERMLTRGHSFSCNCYTCSTQVLVNGGDS